MDPLYTDTAAVTLKNYFYRHVLYTVKETGVQLVLMSLLPGEEIGMEVHPSTTQFIRIESGNGHAIIGNKKYYLAENISIVIPPGIEHNIVNIGEKMMKLYTIYSGKLEHAEGLIEKVKT